MIKQILVALVLVIGLSGLGNAERWGISDYEMDGDGTTNYPNSGWVCLETYDYDTLGGHCGYANIMYTHSSHFAVNISGYGWMNVNYDACTGDTHHRNEVRYFRGNWHYMTPVGFSWDTSYAGKLGGYANPEGGSNFLDISSRSDVQVIPGTSDAYQHAGMTIYISPYTIGTYNITGNTGCLNNVSLYTKINNTYVLSQEDNLISDNYYNFSIINNQSYKLIFSDAHEYEFIVNESDIIYNHDDCTHTQYRFEESCGNLIPDSEGIFVEWLSGSWQTITPFYAPSGILDISNSSASAITVESQTFIGATRWGIDPVVSGTTYALSNPTINWALKVIVQNESDGSLIDDAMVKVDQDCYCIDGYSIRQKMTMNGMAQFGDMSLQDASLFVMKYGYKIVDENTTGYSAFLSGRSNFSSKTWIVKLAPSWSNNSSTFYEVNNKVDIHFRGVNGNRTSKILDTDSEVYLYYENNNTDEEDMTLKFQSSSTHTYFCDELSWNIPFDDIGHKTIANSYFTPYDYSYRAVIYNSSIYGWNITIPLTVRNATKEDEQHYKNLTTNLWFMYADDGKVDYRDDMKVAIHAQSNNTTLMNIGVELWKDGVYIACKNLTEIDFANADSPYYYVWNPVFDYVSGSNYSVRMYGFDRTLLETDYVMCESDNTTRKNKLTIIVKNQNGINVDNAYIYLEEYGSTATGSNYYASFEGLDNGYYRFKATKPDYTGAGWSDITISDDDEIVTYVLSWVGSGSDSTIKQQKMDDTTLRNLYIPLMMLLLILILFGGFKSVI